MEEVGPYLSGQQWVTVREDYGQNGNPGDDFRPRPGALPSATGRQSVGLMKFTGHLLDRDAALDHANPRNCAHPQPG